MSETVSSGPAAPSSSDDRNLAFVGYALLFAAPFSAGLSALVGIVLSYVRRAALDPVVRSHYVFQIKIFWIAVALLALSLVGLVFGLGVVIGDVFDTVTRDGQGWDGWDVASVDASDLRFRPVSLIGFVVWLTLGAATAAWTMLASIFGMARLAAHQPVGSA